MSERDMKEMYIDESYKRFDEYLNDTYGVDIAGYLLNPADVMKQLAPAIYGDLYQEWLREEEE